MPVIEPAADHTITTPNATVTSLATPRLGSSALSTWRVRMEPGSSGPRHTMDQEQVWTVTGGALTLTTDGHTETVPAGRTFVLPAGAERQLQAGAEAVEAMVAMPAGGMARVVGEEEDRSLPWAL